MAASLIAKREQFNPLDSDLTFSEFEKATMKLKNGKAPGITEVPPIAFKLLGRENLQTVYNYVVDFWEGRADYWEWHLGLGVMVPKSGDLSDPNKWRGINLMDVCSKIFSIILNDRLYTLLGKHGTKCQFGATPNKGCRDGSFTLKTLLTQRKEHDQESFVLFVDLVKAYDTVNHELLIEILEQYGAPPKICSAIKGMYTDLTVGITLDGVSAEIPQTVGVRQGDNLSPVLFFSSCQHLENH